MLSFTQFVIRESTEESSHPSGIEGLPAHVKLDHPSFASVHDAIHRGAYRLVAKEMKDHWGHHTGYHVDIHPRNVPKHWKTSKRGDHYDPKHYAEDEHGSITPKDPEKLWHSPEGKEEGHLFRGMSHDEYKNALRQGHLQSHGGYNFEHQNGLTYYSKDKGQAAHYAHGFAPWQHQAVPTKPAVVVKIKDPGNHVHHDGEGEDEVGIRGKVSTKDIRGVHFGHAVSYKPGYFEIRHQYGEPSYAMGSRFSPSVGVHWTNERKPHR